MLGDVWHCQAIHITYSHGNNSKFIYLLPLPTLSPKKSKIANLLNVDMLFHGLRSQDCWIDDRLPVEPLLVLDDPHSTTV
jgi:hypothetical protein